MKFDQKSRLEVLTRIRNRKPPTGTLDLRDLTGNLQGNLLKALETYREASLETIAESLDLIILIGPRGLERIIIALPRVY